MGTRKTRVALVGGVGGHLDERSSEAYLGALRDELIALGFDAEIVTYEGHDLRSYAQDLARKLEGYDVVIPFSLGGLVGRMAKKINPQLERRIWVGQSPVPERGLSDRGFSWTVWVCLGPFLRAFLPPWGGVRLTARHVEKYFGLSPGEAERMAEKLHSEPLLPCLQASFPWLFGLAEEIDPIVWRAIFIPMDDGVVTSDEIVETEAVLQPIIRPQGGHGWVATPEGAQEAAQQIAGAVDRIHW